MQDPLVAGRQAINLIQRQAERLGRLTSCCVLVANDKKVFSIQRSSK